MGKIFDMDGAFFRTLTKIGDFLILDVLMIIFSIPLITAGPAISAVYYVSLKEVTDEEGYVFKSFWKAFKQNFLQGVILELIFVVAGILLYNDLKITYNWAMDEKSMFAKLLMFVLIGFTILVILMGIYTFPMLAKFKNSIRKILLNSLIMAMKHLPQSIIMLIITSGLVYGTISYPPIIIFTIGLHSYAISYIMVRIFKIYIPKEENEPDEISMDTDTDTDTENSKDL